MTSLQKITTTSALALALGLALPAYAQNEKRQIKSFKINPPRRAKWSLISKRLRCLTKRT